MPLVYRVLVVDFHKFSGVVVNLLIKSHCYLVGVNLFHVAGLPALPTQHIEPISPSSMGENFPIGKFPFVLFTGTHGFWKTSRQSMPWLTLIAAPLKISHSL
jgi:hypothetical protein